MKYSVPNTVTVTALKIHDILSTTAWILGAFQIEKTLRAERDIAAAIVGKRNLIERVCRAMKGLCLLSYYLPTWFHGFVQ